jgi:hypothetical protein
MPSRYRFGLKIVANAPDKEGERKKGKKKKEEILTFTYRNQGKTS